MPVFEIQHSDGKTYEVDAPDAASAAGAFSGAHPQQDAAALPPRWRLPGQPPVTPEPVGKQFALGMAQGALELPDVVVSPVSNAFDSVSKAVGSDVRFPTPSRVANAALSTVNASPEQYPPQNLTEKVARVGGAMVPGTLLPMGDPRRLAPGVHDLRTAADADYAAGRAQNLTLTPEAGNTLADQITLPLRAAGYRPGPNPGNHGAVFNAVDELRGAAGANDIESVRRALGRLGENPDMRGASSRAQHGIDDYLGAIPPAHVQAGDAARTSQLFAAGRGNSGAAIRSDELMGNLDRAQRQTEKSVSQANYESPIRQRADAMLNSGDFVNGENRLYGYTPHEVEGLRGVVGGSPVGNALERLGQLDPTRGVFRGATEGGALAAAWHSGDPRLIAAAIGLPAAGIAARRISEVLTRNRMRAVEEGTRLRSPLGQAGPLRDMQSPVGAMILGLKGANDQAQ